MEPPAAVWAGRAVDLPPPLFAALVRSAFISERVAALLVANRSLLEIRRSRTYRSLVAAAAILSRYLPRSSTATEGIVALSAESVAGVAVTVL